MICVCRFPQHMRNAVESSVIGLQSLDNNYKVFRLFFCDTNVRWLYLEAAIDEAKRNETKKKEKKKRFQMNMQSIYLCRLLPHCLYVSWGENDLFGLVACARNLHWMLFFFFLADAENIQTIIEWRCKCNLFAFWSNVWIQLVWSVWAPTRTKRSIAICRCRFITKNYQFVHGTWAFPVQFHKWWNSDADVKMVFLIWLRRATNSERKKKNGDGFVLALHLLFVAYLNLTMR